MTGQRAHRRVIAATCRVHGGAAGFTNLLVTREPECIVFNPHVDQSCVLTIDDAVAHELSEYLRTWLA